jgi:dynein heavy chain
MNTVLDDNKKLCLTSGEIIKLTVWMTMMFEVEDLSQASPATVSRCGMVFLETKQLGWFALIKTFILKLHDNLAKYGELLQNKLKFLCNATLAWIRKYGKFLVHRSEMTFVATMLKLLNTFLLSYGEQSDKIPK